MSKTNPLNFSISSTLATLLNQTENNSNLTPSSIFTWIPSNNTTMYPNINSTTTNASSPWYYNNSSYWNNSVYNPSIYNPYCPDCYPNYVTIDPPLITRSYVYSYAYYILLLLLLVVAIICIKIGISRRKELERRTAAQRRRAIQQSQNVYIASSVNNTSHNDNTANAEAKEFDLPPAYDDVVKSEENATGITTNTTINTISTAISQLTIETEISNSNHASAENLNHISTSSMTDTTDVTTAATLSQPPSYSNLAVKTPTKKIDNNHVV